MRAQVTANGRGAGHSGDIWGTGVVVTAECEGDTRAKSAVFVKLGKTKTRLGFVAGFVTSLLLRLV